MNYTVRRSGRVALAAECKSFIGQAAEAAVDEVNKAGGTLNWVEEIRLALLQQAVQFPRVWQCGHGAGHGLRNGLSTAEEIHQLAIEVI